MLGEKNIFYIGDYIEIILSSSRLFVFLQRDSLLNKIWSLQYF